MIRETVDSPRRMRRFRQWKTAGQVFRWKFFPVSPKMLSSFLMIWLVAGPMIFIWASKALSIQLFPALVDSHHWLISTYFQ